MPCIQISYIRARHPPPRLDMQDRRHIVEKPWGHEEIWAKTNDYVGKILYILDGHRLSLQIHKQKDETIRVLSGVLTLIYNDETLTLYPGDAKHIPPETVHRMEARNGDVAVVEVSTPQLDDVIRLDDYYKRASA